VKLKNPWNNNTTCFEQQGGQNTLFELKHPGYGLVIIGVIFSWVLDGKMRFFQITEALPERRGRVGETALRRSEIQAEG
jgi:hypothetical protein